MGEWLALAEIGNNDSDECSGKKGVKISQHSQMGSLPGLFYQSPNKHADAIFNGP
jgi:hypothetical protein